MRRLVLIILTVVLLSGMGCVVIDPQTIFKNFVDSPDTHDFDCPPSVLYDVLLKITRTRFKSYTESPPGEVGIIVTGYMKEFRNDAPPEVQEESMRECRAVIRGNERGNFSTLEILVMAYKRTSRGHQPSHSAQGLAEIIVNAIRSELEKRKAKKDLESLKGPDDIEPDK